MSDIKDNPPPLDTRWLHNVANTGRGSQMTYALHQAADTIDELRAKLKALEEQKPVAWARRWYVNGEEPRKEKQANGRLAWPIRFKFLPISEGQCMKDDAPLYLSAGAKT